MADLDLDFAMEEAKKARDALDQALAGYGADGRKEQGALALRSAFHAVDAAVDAVAEDIESREQHPERWEERPDPELRWKDDRIERAEEARAREEA